MSRLMWILIVLFALALVIQATAMQSHGMPAVQVTNGFANGWTVWRGSLALCRNPFVDVKRKRIECS